MPLGFHKDSLLNLSELASKHEVEVGETRQSKVVPVVASNTAHHHGHDQYDYGYYDHHHNQDERQEEVFASSEIVSLSSGGSHGNSLMNSTVKQTNNAWGDLQQGVNSAWQSYGADPYQTFYDPYSVASFESPVKSKKGNGNGKQQNPLCCFFAPWTVEHDYVVTEEDEEEVEEKEEIGDTHQVEGEGEGEGKEEHAADLSMPLTPKKDQQQMANPEQQQVEQACTLQTQQNLQTPTESPAKQVDQPNDLSTSTHQEKEMNGQEIVSASEQSIMQQTTCTLPNVVVENNNKSQSQPQLQEPLPETQTPSSPLKQTTPEFPTTIQAAPTSPSLSSPQPSAPSPTNNKTPKRGILRRQSFTFRDKNTKSPDKTNKGLTDSEANKPRRSIIPQATHYSATTGHTDGSTTPTTTTTTSPNRRHHHVRFAPTARVATIPSRHSMNAIESAMIWWTRADYDSFKKTGRMIARAMLEGGSEIWLQSQITRSERMNHSKSANHADSNEYGQKWWCQFGHSRRGLEHIANFDEGRLRQKSVQNSIAAVIKEQRKQKVANMHDPVKLARLSQQYTRWSKELSIVAGLADAEAVRTNFKEANAGSATDSVSTRAKMTRASMYTSYITRQFSLAGRDGGLANGDMEQFAHPSVLDENTASSLLVRLNDEYQLQKLAELRSNIAVGTSPLNILANTSLRGSSTQGTSQQSLVEPPMLIEVSKTTPTGTAPIKVPNESDETYVPVHDPKDQLSSLSISRKAAGFGHGEDEVDRFLEKRFERHQAVTA